MSRILVIGATGRQGGGVVDAAFEKGHEIVAFVRGSDDAANALAERGATVVQGDLDEVATITDAAASVDALFAVTTPFAGLGTEIQHGRNIVEAAATSGVGHVVFSSVASAGEETRIGHFDTKWETEKLLEERNVPTTVVAPAFFMDNYTFPWNLADISRGEIRQAVDADTPLQMVDSSDIGRSVIAAVERGLIGRRIEIAGDSLNGHELALALGSATGVDVSYIRQPDDELDAMGGDWRRMYEWFNEGGFSVDRDTQDELGVDLRSFDRWASAQDWERLLAT